MRTYAAVPRHLAADSMSDEELSEPCGLGVAYDCTCTFPVSHVGPHSWETHLRDPELAEWLDGAPVFAQHEQLVREDATDYAAERAQS